MTKDQVSLIRRVATQDRGDGKPVSFSLSAIFNDEIMFRNTDDFLIYDDDNELIHAIKANVDNYRSAAMAPYKICTGFYGNIQFMEGLYDMANFEKVVDELFLNTGLIDEEKKEYIMKWANGIRNHYCPPDPPGPYYPTVPMIPPHAPKPPEGCRPDGIFHGAPIDHRTKEAIIMNLVGTAIKNNSTDGVTFTMIHANRYKLSYSTDNNTVAGIIKNLIDTIGKNLFYASFSNGVHAAVIFPKDENTTNDFIENAATRILPANVSSDTVKLYLYIEAYGVRVRYDFDTIKVIDEEAATEWETTTEGLVESYVNSISNDAVTSASIYEKSVSIVVNTTDGLDVGFVDFLTGIDGLKSATHSVTNKAYTLTVGDTDSYQSFKEGVLRNMPENGETVNGTMTMDSANGGSLVYTLNVSYYNQADCPVKIGDKYYNTISEACAIGGTIELLKDTAEDVTIPEGATVELSLGGHKITNSAGDTITNAGTLTITGHGTIDNVTHQKAALKNTGTATVNGVTLERSAETGVDANTSGGNSYYTIDNKGTMTLGAGTVVNNAGGYSSNVENGWSNYTSGTATLIIDGATITGGLNAVKNDEGGNLTIESGTFTGASQNAVMNWNVAVINGGTFDSATPTIQNGAYNGSAGDLTITNGTFDTDADSNFMLYDGYPSTNIKVSGGSFSHEVNADYIVSGHEAVFTGGRYVIQEVSAPAQAEEAIDSFIDSLESEGVTIEAVPESDNTYNVVTSTGNISETGILDTMVAQEGVTSVVVSDGEATETYTVGTSDLAAFKAAVDAMVPTANTDAPVTLTITLNF